MISRKISVRKFNLRKLKKYNHPSVSLFRGIELKVLSKVLNKMEINGPSMDLGCGDGYISKTIFKNQFEYGVDNDEAGDVKIAIKKKRYKTVLVQSAEKTTITSNSLNLVFSNSVIEHIPNNEKVLNEVSRVLRKGGYFIFTCPSIYFTKYLTEKFGRLYTQVRNKQFNHYHLLSHNAWKKRLAKHSLKLTNHYYYMDKKTLIFWEKTLWQHKLNKILPFIFDNPKVYNKEIEEIVSSSKTSKMQGANVLIIAQKK